MKLQRLATGTRSTRISSAHLRQSADVQQLQKQIKIQTTMQSIQKASMQSLRDALLIEFPPPWARQLQGSLRATFGVPLKVRWAPSLGCGFRELSIALPDAIFLASAGDRHELTGHMVRRLRQITTATPIIVIGQHDRRSANNLVALGGVAVIHRDSVCSDSLAAAVIDAC